MPPRQRRPADSQAEQSNGKSADLLSTASTVAEKPPRVIRKLLHWDDLPPWQRDNHHIHRGYRPASFSFLVSFQSLAYLHNETVNIYSHLLPALLAIPSAFWLHRTLTPRYETATQADIIAFSCFFAGAAFCLGMSATYHTISNHSPFVARVGNAFDYVGIVGLIVGSFIPSVYYGFYCHPTLQNLYWSMIVLIGFGCACVSVMPRFRTPELRPFRAGMFVGMGLSAIFPVVHGLKVFGPDQMARQMGLFWMLLQGFLYILGATIYAARVPERLKPGRFDILGSSHQIFHVLVVLAAVSHLTGLLKAFDYRHSGLAESCS
ncbi:haemolysin-III channel protein Izh2, putative [Paecilomyces variotii No. 5]|uniref:Haemolysin-III channel protein Izh2, putative n=1 Tax=Byssochlamys spectabilis (strain No. 5 / NBRC 109023) TaxID=1356009 RepID=V5G3Y2_BYSSN|nr:haemolysin-III channel protein Izh2, putative [Paecilomyces variotii No. 5]